MLSNADFNWRVFKPASPILVGLLVQKANYLESNINRLLAIWPWVDPIKSSEPWFSHPLNRCYINIHPPKFVRRNKGGNLYKML